MATSDVASFLCGSTLPRTICVCGRGWGEPRCANGGGRGETTPGGGLLYGQADPNCEGCSHLYGAVLREVCVLMSDHQYALVREWGVDSNT